MCEARCFQRGTSCPKNVEASLIWVDIGTITLPLYACLLFLCVPMTSVERVGAFQHHYDSLSYLSLFVDKTIDTVCHQHVVSMTPRSRARGCRALPFTSRFVLTK